MSDEKLSRTLKYNTEEINIVEDNTDKRDEEDKSSHSFISKVIIFLIVFIIIIVTYATLIGPYYIDIKEYKIENSNIPSTMNGLKIVQFSDIHYGNSINKKQLDKVVSKINSLKPDIVLFTGDLISEDIEINDEIINDVTKSLSKIEVTLYKYAIYGNEDSSYYEQIMNDSNFILLDNSAKFLYYKNNKPIVIIGLGSSDRQVYSTLNSNIDGQDILSYYKIVLIHEPDTIDNFLSYNPDLVLSGHTLGGLIQLPFVKPLFLPEKGIKYYEECYQINNTLLYVSNGLGTSSIKARLNNHPSINLYRIYTTKDKAM